MKRAARVSALPADPFRRVELLLTREQRLRAFAEVVEALADGRDPPPAAARWVGTSGVAWLLSSKPARKNRLEEMLGIAAPPRSKSTPQRLYRERLLRSGARSSAERDPDQDAVIATGTGNDDGSS